MHSKAAKSALMQLIEDMRKLEFAEGKGEESEEMAEEVGEMPRFAGLEKEALGGEDVDEEKKAFIRGDRPKNKMVSMTIIAAKPAPKAKKRG